MKEEWRPILGWEGYYEVSNLGRIRSVDRFVVHTHSTGKRIAKGKILNQHSNDYGYMFVMASKENKQRRIWVHRAVLEAFVEVKPPGMVTMHLDNNPKNNNLSNLKWGTQKENIQQCTAEGRQANVRKTHCPRGHELVESNLVKHHLKRGKRACYSCNWASQRFGVKRSGEDVIKQVSDDVYASLGL